ncbi:MAG: o-succinylbenzoate synthase [Saprospiraceae bacterium]
MQHRNTRYDLLFRFDAGTSRGIMRQKTSWFLKLEKDNRIGIGEFGILKGLSVENFDSFEEDINKNIREYSKETKKFNWSSLNDFPVIKFGLEMAHLDLARHGNGILFDNAFTRGESSIPINGLVWMGDYRFMFEQIKEKIDMGFECIKIKIGAIDFEEELSLLKYMRSEFAKNDIEIRVDANGGFKPENALEKLKLLSDYHLHSIEQPIRQGQWEEMAKLCLDSPLPIALDEELIGISNATLKIKLLDTISPHYIIIKPSLLGGYMASEEWIALAKERKIGYWVTSALESNIGLNAIAQWTYEMDHTMPQGLGTGLLYHNNFEGPLYIKNGALHFNSKISVYENFNLFS